MTTHCRVNVGNATAVPARLCHASVIRRPRPNYRHGRVPVLVLALLASTAVGLSDDTVGRPRFPDPRNFAAQSNSLPPLASSFEHMYAPLPQIPDDFTIARVPVTYGNTPPHQQRTLTIAAGLQIPHRVAFPGGGFGAGGGNYGHGHEHVFDGSGWDQPAAASLPALVSAQHPSEFEGAANGVPRTEQEVQGEDVAGTGTLSSEVDHASLSRQGVRGGGGSGTVSARQDFF